MEAVKSFKKRKYTARLMAGFMKTWWEPTVLWTHENQGVKHRTSMKKLRFLVIQEQSGLWALLKHNRDTYQITRCREIITLTFLGRVYAAVEIITKVGRVWSSRWTWSWIGLLLLTVTDFSTACAVVIFRVKENDVRGNYWCILRNLLGLF